MAKDVFHDRERAEEAAYFHQRDEKLMEKLRQLAAVSEVAEALAKKLEVDNPQLLARIVALGITLETGAAFLMAPLVQVAWADGVVTREEQDMVLKLAEGRGVKMGSADETQLRKWMVERPPQELFDTALEAISVGLSVLPYHEADDRAARIMDACIKVAEATEGILKALHLPGRVTPREQQTLDAIRAGLNGGHRVPPGEIH